MARGDSAGYDALAMPDPVGINIYIASGVCTVLSVYTVQDRLDDDGLDTV
jgi:hypothetical protein